MKTAICLLLLVALGCNFADARRGRGHGRGKGRRPGDTFAGFNRSESFSVWNRTVGDGEVTQEGQSNDTESKFVLLNVDRRFLEQGLNFSVLLVDFSTPVPTATIRTRSGCYRLELITPNLTYATAAAELKNRNGTTVTAPLKDVKLNATGPKLTDAERALLSPAVNGFCRHRVPIYNTTSVADSTLLEAGPEEMVFTTLTLNARVAILAKAEPDYGRGGRRGGRPYGQP